MLMVNQLAGFGGNARRPVNISYLGELHTTTDATSFTEGSQSLGTAQWDRVIVVATCLVTTTANETVTGVTIGGSAATLIAECTEGTNGLHTAFWALQVPSGTSADIVATCSASAGRFFMGYWRLTGTRGNTTVAASNNDDAGTALATSVSCLANGGVIGISACFSSTLSSETGITEDYGTAVDTLDISAGHDNKTSAATVNYSATAGDARARQLLIAFSMQ